MCTGSTCISGVTADTVKQTGNKCNRDPEMEHEAITRFQVQSATVTVDDIPVEASVEVDTNVTFVDNSTGVVAPDVQTNNAVAMVDGTEDLSLGTFLSRPTLIDTTTWTTSNVVSVLKTVTPWQAFLNNAVIKRKIDNYAFLRAKMKIKVVINGTPFQYGLLRVCYNPLLGTIPDKIRTASSGAIGPSLIPYSQQPGVYIHPQANAGAEMKLPFFYMKNWLDITSSSDVTNFGTLRYVIYDPLKVAVTGATTRVTIRTYAWLEDVHLMGSTNSLSLQAGDEWASGPISQPASAISKVASMLSSAPIIGKFAKATEIGAGAAAKMAALFGYTNVPVIVDVPPMQPMNAPHLASAHIGQPIQKLTLDPKQEISIDPSLHGLNSVDELSLTYLKQKESYFGATTWETADTVGEHLFSMRVGPSMFAADLLVNGSSAEVGYRTFDTPLSYISRLFRHWRGDVHLRMKVVCSKFHKGRLKISYDPLGANSGVDVPENTVYTQIVDIGESDDVDICIPYHQALAWLKCRQEPSAENFSINSSLTSDEEFDNGLLTIRVLTELTAPVSSSVTILFYLRGGDNFEFANPIDRIGGTTSYKTPSFFAIQGSDQVDITPEVLRMGPKSEPQEHRYLQNFGENVCSLRSLLHRATTFEITPFASATVEGVYLLYKKYNRMPYLPGFQTGFVTNATRPIAGGSAGYCFNTMPPLAYISGMFLGYRGSVNYYVTPDGTGFLGDLYDCRVYRVTRNLLNTATDRFGSSVVGYVSGDLLSTKARDLNIGGSTRAVFDGTAGQAVTAQVTNGSLCFQVPDYNNYNFALVDPTKYLAGNALDGTDHMGVNLVLPVKRRDTTVNTGLLTISSAVAAGPDFTCLYFLCCPTLDFITLTPNAAA